jgi:hypothetical protein
METGSTFGAAKGIRRNPEAGCGQLEDRNICTGHERRGAFLCYQRDADLPPAESANNERQQMRKDAALNTGLQIQGSGITPIFKRACLDSHVAKTQFCAHRIGECLREVEPCCSRSVYC